VERYRGTLSLHLGFWVGLSLQDSSHQSGLPLYYVFFNFPFFQKKSYFLVLKIGFQEQFFLFSQKN